MLCLPQAVHLLPLSSLSESIKPLTYIIGASSHLLLPGPADIRAAGWLKDWGVLKVTVHSQDFSLESGPLASVTSTTSASQTLQLFNILHCCSVLFHCRFGVCFHRLWIKKQLMIKKGSYLFLKTLSNVVLWFQSELNQLTITDYVGCVYWVCYKFHRQKEQQSGARKKILNNSSKGDSTQRVW